MYKIQVLLILLLAAVSANAQPLSVTIEKIDATRLPRMKMEAAVQWNGSRLPSVQGLALSVIENGVTLPADVWCPDTASGTAVALVLDNSGSMSDVSFDSLKAGALSVVRMLEADKDTAPAVIYHSHVTAFISLKKHKQLLLLCFFFSYKRYEALESHIRIRSQLYERSWRVETQGNGDGARSAHPCNRRYSKAPDRPAMKERINSAPQFLSITSWYHGTAEIREAGRRRASTVTMPSERNA